MSSTCTGTEASTRARISTASREVGWSGDRSTALTSGGRVAAVTTLARPGVGGRANQFCGAPPGARATTR
jgi:hypothetical protein